MPRGLSEHVRSERGVLSVAHMRVARLAVLICVTASACNAYDADLLANAEHTQSTQSQLLDASIGFSALVVDCTAHDVDGGDTFDGLGQRCELSHAIGICSEGACMVARCEEGFRDCNQLAADGCEVAADDAMHCGACGRTCVIPHASALCIQGQCQIAECDSDWADCDRDGRSCESMLASSEACGVCGRSCAAGCLDGKCVGPAQSADDCSAADLSRDINHCGDCRTACAFQVESAHASPACAEGSCRAVCEDGFGDCDGNFENGCEQPLDTLDHCAGCDTQCAVQNALTSCASGSCQVVSCAEYYGDCDEDAFSCEQSLVTQGHCGECDKPCQFPHARAVCARTPGSASCNFQGCDLGWDDCNHNLIKDGCERDVRPLILGGQGPCLPSRSCQTYTFSSGTYYVCTEQVDWEDADDACRTQRDGHLVNIESLEEEVALRVMIQQSVVARVWAGHTDRERDDLWKWGSTGVPFWRGLADGSPIAKRYAHWASGEPDGSGPCGAFSSDGTIDDEPCNWEQGFACEVAADRCPMDANKNDPGQCGCGRIDTDADGDGIAECP